MIINDFLHKIKGKSGIDSNTIICLCIVVLVGIISFGLGRLSVGQKGDNISNNIKSNQVKIIDSKIIENKNIIGNSVNQISNLNSDQKRMYVASKNGKLYYSIGCTGAKRILPANEVWFASAKDAEIAGYTLSKSCK